ncbi:porin [Halomonas marinisediminis]|uniref:Porin n=1 Tax=Halomonas marinisediminis TaxID=2546095 RepID=A0ABY2D3H6_9GAMM|nr:porin [Halomonas marinisediminis]TDA95794.1 porin [Halomonas marinisediminis]
MKKTLLATAIAGAMIATGAQAATVYDQDGTKLDVYGRIAMGIAGGGPEYNDSEQKIDNGTDFVDVFSRLGLRMSHAVSSDTTAFGRVEWRFKGDERYTDSGFTEVRQSYIGLRNDNWGTIQGGNFDSFYNQAVSIPFDVYIDRGLEFAGHPIQSRGDSVGYITPNLSGFQVYLQGKHYSSRGELEPSEGTTVAAQGGAVYEINNLRLAAGFVDDVEEGGGNDEVLYGATVSYEFVPGFSGRLGYETQDENDVNGGGHDTWGLGLSYSSGPWAVNADIYDVDPEEGDSRTSWALGGYYNVTSNFQAFTELQQADQQSISVDIDGLDSSVETADGDDMYYLVGARYFF